MRPRIAVCVPTRGINFSGFTIDLAWLMVYSVQHIDATFGLLTGEHTYIPENRCDIAGAALLAKADWSLWLDDDMRFPKDALARLLAHREPIVGANYSGRRLPPAPMAVANVEGERLYTTPEKHGLEEAVAVGGGVLLIRSDVFGAVGFPWFENFFSRERHRWVGEDVDFCNKVREAGYRVMVDHDLSREVRHMGVFEYTIDHTLAWQEEFGGNHEVQRTEDGGLQLVGADGGQRHDGEGAGTDRARGSEVVAPAGDRV